MPNTILYHQRGHKADSLGFLGHAELNNPEKLNTLDHAMVLSLTKQLKQWEVDPLCQAILITGAGDKAFCAGGDVKKISQKLDHNESFSSVAERATNYFKDEYALDLALHLCSKPLIVWAHGFTFGGGMGILQSAQFRIISDSTSLAMPETSIGFIPDVGASFFLNKVPYGIGQILALSGGSVPDDIAMDLDLADSRIKRQSKEDFLSAFDQCHWSNNQRKNKQIIAQIIAQFEIKNSNYSLSQDVLHRLKWISQLHDWQDKHQALIALSESNDTWLQQLSHSATQSSRLALNMTHDLLTQQKHASLIDCFNAELEAARNIINTGEFTEGVRAKLIDKDNKPRWPSSQW